MYRDLADGRALGAPRIDNLAPNSTAGAYYAFKQMGGTWPARSIQALRINSDVITHPVIDGRPRRVKVPAAGGRWVGLVALFSTETGELLALFPDGVMQRLRVGAANGLAARYLGRADASEVALIGTGWQAGAQLMALRAVRPISRVRIYSLTPADGLSVTVATSAEECVRGADLIVSATSSMSRTIDPGWLRPGVHASCIKGQEVDAAVLRRCDRVVVHTRDQSMLIENVLPGTPNVSADATVAWWSDPSLRIGELPDLPALVAGRAAGRERADEITCFVNNLGTGLQFAALGALLLDRARAAGAGRDLPREWFTESVHP
jgi:ornithine cyclodeaminase/alanine dehydrogenase-like protein (mu-crystallin family)